MFGRISMVAKIGSKVKVEYAGTLEDGTVFDSSEKHGKPLEFEIGSGQVIKGFEDAVVGMSEGQEKDISLRPSQAYGDRNPDLVKKVPRHKIPQEITAGMMLVMKLQNGMDIPAKIIDVSNETVTIDLNPPLAGKTLNFKVKVVEIA